MGHSLKELIKDNTAILIHVCEGIVYYEISVGNTIYQLGLDSNADEWKAVYLKPHFPAITLMRWIRKGMEDGSLVKLN